MRRWIKFWNLSSAEKLILLQALVSLPVVSLMLSIIGYRKSRAFLMRFSPSTPLVEGAHEAERKAQEVARMVRIAASNLPFRFTCLPESLTLWWLLIRRRIAANLQIGVAKETGKLEAHAWVECDGVALNQNENLQRFKAL